MKYSLQCLLIVLLCSGCDPAGTLFIKAQVKSGYEARNLAVTELKKQRFQIRPQDEADSSCSYMWRETTESRYPRRTFTTYADVCASGTSLQIQLSDFPRFGVSSETNQLREHMQSILTQQFGDIDFVIE